MHIRLIPMLLLCCAVSQAAQGGISVTANTAAIGTYGVFELTVTHDDAPYGNVWENVEITCPFVNSTTGDSLVMYGFYYDTDTWKVRFAPPTEGAWTWGMSFDTGSGVLTESGAFTCTGSARKGFPRRHADNPYRMVYADGSLYDGYGLEGCLTVGLDIMYVESEKKTVEEYAALFGNDGAGMSLFRWTIDNTCTFRIYEELSVDGNRYRVAESKAGDRLVQALSNQGIRVMLTFFGYEAGFGTCAWDSPDYWNEDQQRAVKHYLRYMVARYGVYTDIWEMMNEHLGRRDWLEMFTGYVRSVDPYDRLITTSWEMAYRDFIDMGAPHLYFGVSDPLLCDSAVIASPNYGFRKQKSIAEKPVVYGEFGNFPGNWFGDDSPTHMRIVGWTAFFYEVMLVYWHDGWKKKVSSGNDIYLDSESRRYIRHLTGFTGDVHPDVRMFEPEQLTPGIRSYGLKGGNMLACYFHHHASHTTNLSAAFSVDLPGPGTAFWYSPATGDTLSKVPVSAGTTRFDSPSFNVDCALKVVLDDAEFSSTAVPAVDATPGITVRTVPGQHLVAVTGPGIDQAVLFNAAGAPVRTAANGMLRTDALPAGMYCVSVPGAGYVQKVVVLP